LKHPADFSVAVVRIVGPIAPDSGPDSFERCLSFEILLYPFARRRRGGVTIEWWCVPWVHKRPARLRRFINSVMSQSSGRASGQQRITCRHEPLHCVETTGRADAYAHSPCR
jgi:hypothetical protein